MTWRPEIARLRVSRVVSVIDAGRIINPLLARNQIEGSVAMGIGMALFEGTEYDPRNGAPINASLADYVVATNADVPALEVHFIEYPDLQPQQLRRPRRGRDRPGWYRRGDHQCGLSCNRGTGSRASTEAGGSSLGALRCRWLDWRRAISDQQAR